MLDPRRTPSTPKWYYQFDGVVPWGVFNDDPPLCGLMDNSSRRMAVARYNHNQMNSYHCSGQVLLLDYCLGWTNGSLVSSRCSSSGNFYASVDCDNCSVNKTYDLTCECKTAANQTTHATINLGEEDIIYADGYGGLQAPALETAFAISRQAAWENSSTLQSAQGPPRL
ncbi:Uu.00g058040.m01.CDS01 [Anthostomella pinea]|uniref:Uu.00g058040.m01.CDS01 n=1 Tax=Anthostomella pinea TaxID=933095 RepID=A0AAI8YM93_9PEZI|nr:Uu.00g058040.m01.CDS01 [Anthostomella pinea]